MSIKKIAGFFIRGKDNGNGKEVVFSEKSKRELDQIILELGRYEAIRPVKAEEYKGSRKKFELYNKWNELLAQIEQYYVVWIKKDNLRSQFDCANNVLTAYYENGQILDYLERINKYISELVDEENLAVAFKACYNNYVFFLSHYMKELKDNHEKCEVEKSPNNSDVETTRQWIKENELSKLQSVLAFKKKLNTAKVLKRKILQQVLTATDEKAFRSLTGFMEEYNQGTTEFERFIIADIATIKTQTSQINDQIANMNIEIQNAGNLYKVLTSVLSPEWFEQFDVEKNGDIETTAELRDFLVQAMSRVNEEILKVYTRK